MARFDREAKELKQLAELKLSREEDAPMCIAVDRKVRLATRGLGGRTDDAKLGAQNHLRRQLSARSGKKWEQQNIARSQLPAWTRRGQRVWQCFD